MSPTPTATPPTTRSKLLEPLLSPCLVKSVMALSVAKSPRRPAGVNGLLPTRAKAQLHLGMYASNSSAAGSSAFSQFLTARRQRGKTDSLSEDMGTSPAMQQQQQQFVPGPPQPVPFQHAPAPDPLH
ncbi:hypothetical protein PHYSODRAFT_322032 [Phytophthora sojae]|uniref:Uncharacterized protein n=1 Tax=Phytophthora sojae (strain P6497) TaxID=1094619 RepID=G4YG16_PHYSP|nr:hypothetical protein PHYSODRAFT_322032 [Phytophthora sojae]EGZ28359.1 hypothetical protein PHYSODRAFT_322032 [Phytophthora sojae]|eukprot:XP_009515634.1 hypothetical protein PHYSODRAFT_322032 [Phytophthora sojae]